MKSNLDSFPPAKPGTSLSIASRPHSVAGQIPDARRTGYSLIRRVHEHFAKLRHLSPAEAARLMQPYLS